MDSVLVTTVLLMVQPTAMRFMDTRKISISAAHAHVILTFLSACTHTLGATEMTVIEILTSVLYSMATPKSHAEKLVLISHTLPSNTMAGAHVTTNTVIQPLNILRLTMKNATMVIPSKESEWEEVGLMLSITTSDT